MEAQQLLDFSVQDRKTRAHIMCKVCDSPTGEGSAAAVKICWTNDRFRLRSRQRIFEETIFCGNFPSEIETENDESSPIRPCMSFLCESPISGPIPYERNRYRFAGKEEICRGTQKTGTRPFRPNHKIRNFVWTRKMCRYTDELWFGLLPINCGCVLRRRMGG